MWRNLKLKFAASNQQNIVQLKTNLQNIKKGSDNIETYLDRTKAARDALETVGVFLDDEDIVVTVLRGLPSEFAAIKTVIHAQFVNSTLPELKSLLQAAEINIELEAQETSVPLTAMIAKTSSPTASMTQASASTTSISPTCPSSGSQISSPSTPTLHSSPQTFVLSTMPQSPNVPIPALPYGFGSINPYAEFNPMQMGTMTGFYARRNGGNGNNNFQQGNRGSNNNFQRRPGDNFGGNTFNRTTTGSSLTCQLCGRVGHGAKTCKTLSNLQQGSSSNDITCQYCGKNNHTADRCFFIIGFPNQQQHQNSNSAASSLCHVCLNSVHSLSIGLLTQGLPII